MNDPPAPGHGDKAVYVRVPISACGLKVGASLRPLPQLADALNR